MTFILENYLNERRVLVEHYLSGVVSSAIPAELKKACDYSLMAGGKRLRPILTLAACEAVGGQSEDGIAPALALEMIHTYSLIHDDLPAMDNDDFRRGRPTNHKVFGEAMAILAGDALLTEAFAVVGRVISDPRLGSRAARCVIELAVAAGAGGMVGGQVLDIQATGKKPSEAELVSIHRLKTGALFVSAAVMGGIMGGGNDERVAALGRFAEAAGLGFQIIDDVLDVTADLATLGKDPGSDKAKGKHTYVDVLGVDGAKARAHECLTTALKAIGDFDNRAEPLRAIATHLIDRTR